VRRAPCRNNSATPSPLSFEIADYFQATILKLNTSGGVRAGSDSKVPAKFERDAAELASWMDTVAKPAQSPELAVLQRIDTAYDAYRHTEATPSRRSASHQLGEPTGHGAVARSESSKHRRRHRVRPIPARSGTELEKAHRAVWAQALEASRESLPPGALHVRVLLLLLAWASGWRPGVSRVDRPAPLETGRKPAVIERQEKSPRSGMLAAGVAHEIRNR